MSDCIICKANDSPESVEHIVPRSLGNIHYVLRKGIICQRCNNRFSKHEHAVLNSLEWFEQRRALGLISNKSETKPHLLEERHLEFMLVKMFYESVYHSRRKLFGQKDFEGIRAYLAREKDISLQLFRNQRPSDMLAIPGWIDRWRLRRNGIYLYYRIQNTVSWFAFSFGDLHYSLKINDL